jgi:ATP-dependent DNA ligase
MDSRDKRLAIRVEDHELGYPDFEGIIPVDEYGAGAVIVWERDDEASAAGRPVLSRTESVLSDRTIDQLAAEVGWSSTRR